MITCDSALYPAAREDQRLARLYPPQCLQRFVRLIQREPVSYLPFE